MRGVPLAITSCIPFGLPLAESFDSTGPYCALLSWGLAWQTRHDWLNRCSPCRWVSLRSCAKAGVAASASAISHACRMSFLPICLLLPKATPWRGVGKDAAPARHLFRFVLGFLLGSVKAGH